VIDGRPEPFGGRRQLARAESACNFAIGRQIADAHAPFFSFVIDVFSRRVVGWQLASHMRTDLVLDALCMALSRRRAGAAVELVHHSDAGSQPGLKRSLQHRGYR